MCSWHGPSVLPLASQITVWYVATFPFIYPWSTGTHRKHWKDWTPKLFARLTLRHYWIELCAAAPPPPTACPRRGGAVFVTCSCHVYTSYMLLDFCNAVYSEARTLTKSSKNDVGVFCNSPYYSIETWRRRSKVFSWTSLWKWKLMLKGLFGTSLKIWLLKRMVQWKI